ncbi:hypothetical protein ANN_13341 [Periplaneta americana]|uniref:Reverse transcriptase n=1 Tax=Periplaneta americana TaxID=6978 RepID=A0ABQ8TL80_PERAM|nr:hypothetical protein ANN_13341 [Periplaneta americana]
MDGISDSEMAFWQHSCEQYGMKINANKTNAMVIGRKIQKINLRILNDAVEQVDSFKYLGCTTIRNEAVLERVDEERMMLKLIRKRKRNWLSHWLRRNCLLKDAMEEMVNERRVRGRRRYQMIDDIKIYGSYGETKRKAENRKDWRMLSLQLAGQNYTDSLHNNLSDYLENMPLASCRQLFFIHNVAPSHFSLSARWIGRGGPIAWPLRSPDLSPRTFTFRDTKVFSIVDYCYELIAEVVLTCLFEFDIRLKAEPNRWRHSLSQTDLHSVLSRDWICMFIEFLKPGAERWPVFCLDCKPVLSVLRFARSLRGHVQTILLQRAYLVLPYYTEYERLRIFPVVVDM